jgi:endonuclease YncB( thermonuclease family)
LQEEQLKAGMSYVYEKYLNNCPNADAVRKAEAIARSANVGVWNGPHEKPWDFRKRNR